MVFFLLLGYKAGRLFSMVFRFKLYMRLFILKFTKRQLRFPLVFIVFMYQSLKCSMILIFIYISTIPYEAEQFMNSNLTETLHKTWVWQKAKPYQVSAQYSDILAFFNFRKNEDFSKNDTFLRRQMRINASTDLKI